LAARRTSARRVPATTRGKRSPTRRSARCASASRSRPGTGRPSSTGRFSGGKLALAGTTVLPSPRTDASRSTASA